jgi:hypothetical protein
MNVYKDLSFSFNSNGKLTNDEIEYLVNKSFDKRTESNYTSFTGKLCTGSMCNLKLTNEVEVRTKNDGTITHNIKFFDGFCIKANMLKNYNFFRGNVVSILDDENLVSLVAEDTVKGIYESKREFAFNSEELNKSFDCKVSGYAGFNDIDEMMMQVHKIITPSFEEHLLYLRERYNSFNMRIWDEGFTFAVNLDRSILQKLKHKELLDFSYTYREKDSKDNFKMLHPDVNGIEDFAYYNVFPFLERLYLIQFLTYLYLSYVDFGNYYDMNNVNIKSFEENMRNVYTMEYRDFKKIYTDEIKNIKNSTKEFLKKFEKNFDEKLAMEEVKKQQEIVNEEIKDVINKEI